MGDEPDLRREIWSESWKRRRDRIVDDEAARQTLAQHAPVEALVIVKRHVAVHVVDRPLHVWRGTGQHARDVFPERIGTAPAIGVNPSKALILSQVVLSFGIPFALIPLVMFCRNHSLMGGLVNRRSTTIAAIVVAIVIIALNAFLLQQTLLS